MYGDGGPPGNQGKPPTDVCDLRSRASADSRLACAPRGSRTLIPPFGPASPPRDVTSQGVSSSAIFRFGSRASQLSRGVVRFAISAAIFAAAGESLGTLETMPVDRKRVSG